LTDVSLTLASLGHFGLILTLTLEVVGIFFILARGEQGVNFARKSIRAIFYLFFISTAALVVLILGDHFNIAYVYGNSNKDLPSFYKVAVLWSGQEGSLLFWALILSIYGYLADRFLFPRIPHLAKNAVLVYLYVLYIPRIDARSH